VGTLYVSLNSAVAFALLLSSAIAYAQDVIEPSGTSDVASRNLEEHDRRVLEENVERELTSGADEFAKERRRSAFKAAYRYVVANPKYADSKQNQRLLEEVLLISEDDRRTRRVRPIEDVLEIAAQRVDAREREETKRREWNAEVESFLNAHPVYRTDTVLLEAFDSTVRTLGTDPRTEHRDARWFLEEAHVLVRSKFPDRF
jgi:hypothetical protein